MHIWSPWKLSNFLDPQPLCLTTSKILPSFWHSVPNDTPTLPTNDNQSFKRKSNPRITMICYQVFPLGQLFFSIHLLILSGFPLASFYLAKASLVPAPIFKKLETSFMSFSSGEKMCWSQVWAKASLYAFLGLCILVCALVQKNQKVFRTHFAINLFYFQILEMQINYGGTTTPCIRMNEIKTKT